MFTIKRTSFGLHIEGLATRGGTPIHEIPRSAETGHSFDQLTDAVTEAEALGVPLCRTCRVAVQMILNRR